MYYYYVIHIINQEVFHQLKNSAILEAIVIIIEEGTFERTKAQMNDQEELSPKGRQEVEQEQVKSNRSSSLTELSQYEEPQYNNAPLWLLQERENELEQAHNNIRIGANRKSMSLLPRRAKKRESISEVGMDTL